MGKDYFSDIDTNDEPRPRRAEDVDVQDTDERSSSNSAEKSIRNISVSPRRNAMTQRMNPDMRRSQPQDERTVRKGGQSKLLLWIVAAVSVVVVGIIALLLMLGKTTVTITPRTHQITFDPSTQFTAYPVGQTTTGGVVYTTQTLEFEDSKTVPATGVEKAEDRASGSITVFNAYSDTTVRLIKNTRFEAPGGLVYRIPASVEVPGRKGATPGQITITVFADQAGAQYNIAPTDKFTLPGLKNTPDMYNGVYARSSAAFSGGFVGEKPAVTPAALQEARAEIRGRLETKIQESVAGIQNGFAFAALAKIEYESLPTVADAGGAKVSEKARVVMPVFPSQEFAHAIAQAVSADAADSKVTLKPQGQFGAHISGTPPNDLGTAPLVFTLTGSALVVWDVDPQAVQQALIGKDQDAFKPIVSTFLGIKDAQANIAPFWSSTFPSDPSKIEITVVNPTSTQQ